MSVALPAYYSFKPAPVGKDADAELSIYPLKLHSAVRALAQKNDPHKDVRGDQ